MAQTTIHANALYDNTTGNPHNPNTPPQTVCAGFNTTDEMFVLYYLFTEYMPGDENLNLDSLMNNGMVSTPSITNPNLESASIFPNPNKGNFTISLDQKCNDVKLEIYTINGKCVFSKDNILCGNNTFTYSVNINGLPWLNNEGVYFCRLYADNEVYHTKLLIQ